MCIRDRDRLVQEVDVLPLPNRDRVQLLDLLRVAEAGHVRIDAGAHGADQASHAAALLRAREAAKRGAVQ
eukprot:9636200-Prorocentrum_lima.AAC.1